MKTEAAVLWRPGEPVEILEVDLAPPRHAEVLVKITACGVCASDLHVVDGELPEPLPLVLGHEASGVVVEVGTEVESLAPGTTSCSHSSLPAARAPSAVAGVPTSAKWVPAWPPQERWRTERRD